MSHIIISLDGNIGAGKSTLLNHIRTYLHDIHVVDEPVGQWVELHDKEGKNLFYSFDCQLLPKDFLVSKGLKGSFHLKVSDICIVIKKSC